MQLKIELIKHGIWVQPAGDLDLLVADSLRHELTNALKKYAAKILVFDFSKVTFIDSSGLGVILGRYRQLAPLGGKVSIVGCSPQIYKIIELSGLTRVIAVEEPIKTRIARLKEGM
ncbi:MAG: STAS domain-containing protein [Bacillota bacterium]